jgi:hypothetical protein
MCSFERQPQGLAHIPPKEPFGLADVLTAPAPKKSVSRVRVRKSSHLSAANENSPCASRGVLGLPLNHGLSKSSKPGLFSASLRPWRKNR